MARPVGWTRESNIDTKGFLTVAEMAEYTGLGIQLIRKTINDGEFEDYLMVGKQKKILIHKASYEKFLLSKRYIAIDMNDDKEKAVTR